MSPGNGYFKQGVINQLLEKAVHDFDHVGIFVPDIPAIATYVALGYPENIARVKKVIPQGNNLKNRVKTSINTEGLPPEKIRIFEWQKEDFENNQLYLEAFNFVRELYNTNIDFKKDIKDETANVLENNIFKKQTVTDSSIEIGVHYIISEFSFLLFISKYLKQEKITYVYHHSWPVFEKFIKGEYDGIVKEQITFIKYPEFK